MSDKPIKHLMFVSYTDDNGDCRSQHVFASAPAGAVKEWLNGGLGQGLDATGYVADKNGDVRVYLPPTVAPADPVVRWENCLAGQFRLEGM